MVSASVLGFTQASPIDTSMTNMAVTYSPMHSLDYPLGNEVFNYDNLSASIDIDMQYIAQYFTHARTYYSQYYGVPVADIAKKHNVLLHLGVYMTSESWLQAEIDSAVAAVENNPGTVEAILVGNENLYQDTVNASTILDIVTSIKTRLGAKADAVKFGTVQRVTEYLDSSYDTQTAYLSANLDILGVNLYPFFSDGYDASKPTAILDSLWNMLVAKFPASQLLLTETGFPTAGESSSSHAQPALNESIHYFKAVVDWMPTGNEDSLKFWFDIFDRRPDDNSMSGELEKHFGLYTYNRTAKAGYPLPGDEWDDGSDVLLSVSSSSASASSASSSSSLASGSGSSCAAEGDNCGSDHDGAHCCESGSYCQPWNPWYYQCRASPEQCGVQEVNVDYFGEDISKVFGILPEACCAKCAKTPGCAAYTYINYNYDDRSVCYLKSGTGTKQESEGAVSAIVKNPLSGCPTAAGGQCGDANGATCCPSGTYCQPWNIWYYQCISTPARCSRQYTNVDFVGNDLSVVYGLQPDACCAKCSQTTGCKAYTFINDNPGRTACYLKSSTAGKATKTGAVSGIVN
ncbi:Glucan 1,3-beta-glucosidase [Phytophthora ramorum]|nr:Glucan 1,3-beta-glucosidase [Phytophthora ramorum]